MAAAAVVGRCLFVVVAMGLVPPEACAWRPEASDPVVARFVRVDSSQGLSQDSVMSLAQDDRGFLWLGTQDGLNRWDGREMVGFRAVGTPGSIGGNWISTMAHDPRGWLWVGTSAGLFRQDYRDERFTAFHAAGARGHYVYDLFAGGDGSLWVGSDAGLERWRPGLEVLQSWPGAEEDPQLGDRRIRAIADAGAGQLWLGTTSGLRTFDIASERFAPAPAALATLREPVNDLFVDSRGLLWIATDSSGTLIFDPESGSVHPLPALEGSRSYVVNETAEGWIWVGSESYALSLPAGPAPWLEQNIHFHRHHAQDPYSLGRGRVRAVLPTRSDGVWLGTWDGGASGLHAVRSRFLSRTPYSPGGGHLMHPSVLSLASESGRLWIGGMRGVHVAPAPGDAPELLPGSASLSAYALAVLPDALLVGADSGLHRFDRTSGDWEPLQLPAAMRGARIRRLMADRGRLWLHAELRGLYVLELATLELVAAHDFAGGINHLLVADDDVVLVSASDGLHWFSRDGRRRLHVTGINAERDGLDRTLAGRPSGIGVDRDGQRWVGLYGNGLARMDWRSGQPPDSARFPLVLTRPALANDGVNSVTPDGRGILWLATDRGVSRFDPSRGEVINFDHHDGALARGYYFSAATQVASDQLALGSKDGYTLFDPGHAPEPRRPMPPRLTAVEVDGHSLPVADSGSRTGLPVAPPHLTEWSLAPGRGRSLIFRFASPDPLMPAHLRYRVQLQGFDPEWQQVDGSRGYVAYGNLPPGDFVLRMEAIGRDGSRSDPTTLALRVNPFWWQTWSARVGGVLLLVLVGTLLYRLRMARLRQLQQQLELRVAERTRVAEDARLQAETALDELRTTQDELVRSAKLSALGQLVAGVAHEVNTPLGVALTASSHFATAVGQMRGKLQEGRLGRREFEDFLDATEEGSRLIQRNVERAADLVGSFKQVSVDRSSDGRREFELAQFLADLTTSLRLLWKHRPVSLQIDCEPGLVLDSFPGALGQILTNLVQNALLHAFSEGTTGVMRIGARASAAERVCITFSDDGRGMPEDVVARAFEPFFTTRRGSGGTGLGLHIVHNLVRDKLGGTLRLHSQPGHGARFEIDLPRSAP